MALIVAMLLLTEPLVEILSVAHIHPQLLFQTLINRAGQEARQALQPRQHHLIQPLLKMRKVRVNLLLCRDTTVFVVAARLCQPLVPSVALWPLPQLQAFLIQTFTHLADMHNRSHTNLNTNTKILASSQNGDNQAKVSLSYTPMI